MRLGRLLAIFLTFTGSCLAVYYGQPRTDLLTELGKPVAAITRSGREILMYPRGVRVELVEGKVVIVQGMPVQEGPGLPVASEPAPDPAAASGNAPVAGEVERESEAVQPTPEQQRKLDDDAAEAEKEFQEASAKARVEMEKAIGDLENLHDQAQHPPTPRGFDWMEFATQLGVGWVLTLIALRIACKYWGAEVFWSGLMTVAFADVAVKAVLGFIGMKLLGMPMLFYADEAAGALAMILILQRVSINRSLQQAVTITLTTKVFSIVVGSLLMTVLLNAL